jgi:hypothetical protein
LLLGIDLGARLIYAFGHLIPQIAGGIQYVEFLRRGKELFTGPVESRPYSLYWNRSNGFRYKGYDVPLLKERKRILAYGGSTTFSDHVLKDPQKCWTFLLEQRFLEQGAEIEIANCGLNYGLSSELVSHLLFEGTHFKPDFVILHGPGNDSLPVAIGDTTTDYRKTRKSKALNPRPFEPALLRFSGLARLIYCLMFREYEIAQVEPKTWDSPDIQNDRMFNSDLSSFKNNVRNFVGICLVNNAKVILIDFVQASQEVLESLKPGLSEGMIEITKNMNMFFKELANEFSDSILHIELNTSQFSSSDFADTCHLNESGEMKKAEIIYSSISNFIVRT